MVPVTELGLSASDSHELLPLCQLHISLILSLHLFWSRWLIFWATQILISETVEPLVTTPFSGYGCCIHQLTFKTGQKNTQKYLNGSPGLQIHSSLFYLSWWSGSLILDRMLILFLHTVSLAEGPQSAWVSTIAEQSLSLLWEQEGGLHIQLEQGVSICPY